MFSAGVAIVLLSRGDFDNFNIMYRPLQKDARSLPTMRIHCLAPLHPFWQQLPLLAIA